MIRSEPCSACPYRVDVPSGVWAATEYVKLLPYDAETWAQPLEAFVCHATPDALCHGWAVCHTNRGPAHDLLALRVRDAGPVPAPHVPLFRSGSEAARHGLRDLHAPTPAAVDTAARLMRKHERLRDQ